MSTYNILWPIHLSFRSLRLFHSIKERFAVSVNANYSRHRSYFQSPQGAASSGTTQALNKIFDSYRGSYFSTVGDLAQISLLTDT